MGVEISGKTVSISGLTVVDKDGNVTVRSEVPAAEEAMARIRELEAQVVVLTGLLKKARAVIGCYECAEYVPPCREHGDPKKEIDEVLKANAPVVVR